MSLIDTSGQVNPVLIQLARRASLKVSDTITPDEMDAVLQANWVQRDESRFEIQGEPPHIEDLDLLSKLGCIEEIQAPTGAHRLYDGALLMGGNLSDKVRPRLEFLAEEYRRGAHFKTVYLLGAERALNHQKGEGPNDLQFPKHGLPLRKPWTPKIVPLPTNEIAMMQYVIEQSSIPDAWDIAVVRTPNVPLRDRGFRPANTGDTFAKWQEMTRFVRGRFLVVSNNPFVHYQETNARRILPREMQLFGIGPKANFDLPLGTFLDNLAKQFYEENLLRKRFAA